MHPASWLAERARDQHVHAMKRGGGVGRRGGGRFGEGWQSIKCASSSTRPRAPARQRRPDDGASLFVSILLGSPCRRRAPFLPPLSPPPACYYSRTPGLRVCVCRALLRLIAVSLVAIGLSSPPSWFLGECAHAVAWVFLFCWSFRSHLPSCERRLESVERM